MSLNIEEIRKSKNVAELLDDTELEGIAQQIIRGYELDEDSRAEWKETIDKAMIIAKQVMESKTYPWPGASNVKYPLMSQGAISFASRTYPEIVRGNAVVKANVVGADPNKKLEKRALNVSKFLSTQLLQINKNWEDDLDRLLHILPILGTVFKKTYYDINENIPVSELCRPDEIVVNYDISSLKDARRITHLLKFHKNDIIERMRRGIFCSIDIDQLTEDAGTEDEDAPHELLEQHCYLDLDDDGYQEPYIVTLHKGTGKVLRIVERFAEIEKNNKDEIIKIMPENYFIDFHFIRSSDGGFYSVGLGQLLYPLNKSINSLINQLIDAGTLNNTQGGFIGKALRIKNSEMKIPMGTYKVLDAAAGMDLKNNIVPLPTKEPSSALFQLLGLLINVSKELISSTDVLEGKGPGQNVPATTMLSMIEQGMKVFHAINKRLYRSLKIEFNRIYELNSRYLTNRQYQNVLNDPTADVKIDFNVKDLDILPVADPTMSIASKRLVKAQAVYQMPEADRREASILYLKALEIDEGDIDKLLPPPDPKKPLPPEQVKLQAEAELLKIKAAREQMEIKLAVLDREMEEARLDIQRFDTKIRADESVARVLKMQSDSDTNHMKIELAASKANHEAFMEEVDTQHHHQTQDLELINKFRETNQKIRTGQQDKDVNALSKAAKAYKDVIEAQQPKEGKSNADDNK